MQFSTSDTQDASSPSTEPMAASSHEAPPARRGWKRFLPAALVLIAGIFVGGIGSAGERASLNQAKSSLTSQVSTFQEDVGTLKAQVQELEGKLTAAESERDAARSEQQAAATDAETLRTSLATVTGERDRLAEEKAALDVTLEEREETIASIQSEDANVPLGFAGAAASDPAPEQAPAAYYQNCTAARNAGAAPVYSGDPGYGRHLDRDGDGVGCE
ncbi:excalibur calcium-binding domain-containing protein [Leucobacter sp. M11]|uniref:excalibur calcium-binding domain-containing protein n=1 Tax=Leucobacter sp. M11 TaxID=2993565 RepID=UPI002D80D354|nr:excalibur calcium-binding domain-containing protein [Leucobacter sp. M11]MEB4613430.1 excalibur calcium-binding domain-containing protein [Leucobacter sp. M11]